MAAGLLTVPLVPLTAAFFAGRLVSYSLYVARRPRPRTASAPCWRRVGSPLGIALQVVMLAGLVLLLRVDWAARLKRRRSPAAWTSTGRPGGSFSNSFVPERQVGREPLAGDLAGRPPECVVRDAPVLAAAAAHVGTHVARRGAGQKQAAQHGSEWLRFNLGTHARRDCLGGSIGLLTGDAALLDGRVGGISGGVDVMFALHQPVKVDWDEAVGIGCQSV